MEDDKQLQTSEEQTEPIKVSRATQEELQKRIRSVENMLVKGWPEGDIIRFIVESEKKSCRTAERAIEEAKARIALKGEDSSYLNGLIVSRFNLLFLETTTGPNKNTDQAIRVFQGGVGLVSKNQKAPKGKQKNEPIESSGASESTLSPELQGVVDRIRKQPAKFDLANAGESA